jgi:hypothetical protein
MTDPGIRARDGKGAHHELKQELRETTYLPCRSTSRPALDVRSTFVRGPISRTCGLRESAGARLQSLAVNGVPTISNTVHIGRERSSYERDC